MVIIIGERRNEIVFVFRCHDFCTENYKKLNIVETPRIKNDCYQVAGQKVGLQKSITFFIYH